MNYYVKKALSFILTLLFVSIISFVLFQLIPGDSAMTKLGVNATAEQLEELREAQGLNDPVPVRFVRFISGAVRGNFGVSTQYGVDAGELVLDRFEVTLGLGVAAMIIIILISVPLGILASRYEGGIIDRIIMGLSQIFMAVPSFFMGMLITLLFGLTLKLFVPGGYSPANEGFMKYLSFIIFPAISIAIPKIAITVRFIKGAMRGEKKQDYVRTVIAKGADGGRLMRRHVFVNSRIPVITFIGLLTAEIFAGSIMTEQVFNIPGMGRLLVSAISNRDFAIVSGVILCIAFVVILVNFCVDILYRVLDPRV